MGTGCCTCAKKDSITPASNVPRDVLAMQRFTNISLSKRNPMTLINGYLDEPIVSLEEALKPFEDKIEKLSYYIRQAKKKCRYPSKHNLSHDESAAIYIYTMKWDNKCLYDHLRDAWKSEDTTKLKPWFQYLKLFRSALDKLPDANVEIWQGTVYSDKARRRFTSKSGDLYLSMGSCLSSDKELKEYYKQRNSKKILLIGYKSVNGKLITDYTVGNLDEVIIWPGLKLSVIDQQFVTSGTFILHISEKIKHFVCPHRGCGNCCPRDHKGTHCHSFSFISHSHRQHCVDSIKCDKCHKEASNLFRCFNCNGCYCFYCCFK